MIRLKNHTDLDGIRTSCALLSEALRLVQSKVAPGVTTGELDEVARTYIQSHGARPAFLGYLDYPATVCISINDQVIHGIPGSRVLLDGDIVSLDCGVELEGYFSDAAVTVAVGAASEAARELLAVTRECLDLGVARALAGGRVRDISTAVFERASAAGYGVVREYCGHGVGYSQHEDPQVPNYPSRGASARLQPGMVLAIEPMLNLGNWEVDVLEDGWTVVTSDGAPSAHFEHTVVVLDSGPEVLTSHL